jgi:hypothetical protein
VKVISALTLLAVAVAVALAVAAYVLPRLLPALTVLFVFAVVARAVWFYTR